MDDLWNQASHNLRRKGYYSITLHVKGRLRRRRTEERGSWGTAQYGSNKKKGKKQDKEAVGMAY
jgi:hypothetical protein